MDKRFLKSRAYLDFQVLNQESSTRPQGMQELYSSNLEQKTIVFDIDETIFYTTQRSLDNGKTGIVSKKLCQLSPTVTSCECNYLPIPYLKELFESCIQHDFKVHFFSAGGEGRGEIMT